MGNCNRWFSHNEGSTTDEDDQTYVGSTSLYVTVRNPSIVNNTFNHLSPALTPLDSKSSDGRPSETEKNTPGVRVFPHLRELQSHSHGIISPSKSSIRNILISKLESESEDMAKYNESRSTIRVKERKYHSLPHFKDVLRPGTSNRFLEFTSSSISAVSGPPQSTKRRVRTIPHVHQKVIASSDDLFRSSYDRRKPRYDRRRTPIVLNSVKSLTSSDSSNRIHRRNPNRLSEYKANTEKPEKVTKFLQDVLMECNLFKGIGSDDVTLDAINRAIKDMYTLDLEKGEVLVKQGDVGDAFFVVDYGALNVKVEESDDGSASEEEKKIITVATINARETVGEAALMYNTKRTATLEATGKTRVWVMKADQFHKIRDLVKKWSKKKTKELQDFLGSIPLFAKFKVHEIANLAQAFREVKFDRGKNIETELLIIRDGKASVMHERKNSFAICQDEEISRGQWFRPRDTLGVDSISVKAATEVRCLTLEKDDYDLLIAPYLMTGNEEEWEDSDPETDDDDSTSGGELPKDFKNRVQYTLEDFKPIAHVGSGNFGRVVLVKVEKNLKHEDEVFALKIVEKNKVINTGQMEHTKNERRVMFMMNSPFCVKLFGTYQDEICVYFLLESVMGGELWTLLRCRKTFSEYMARFYMGCVVLGLEHIHSHKIIYRDLKPENLLISGEGYLKIADFGFAKKRNQSTSLCGTPDYLAPELITGAIQNFGVDWWCTGIFLYEMLVGQVPFQDSESMKLYEDIMESTPQLPDWVSVEAQELVHKLLQKNAFRRLGSRGGAGDIKKQDWFVKCKKPLDKFMWGLLASCELKAPYVPQLRSNEDASHFDPHQQKYDMTELSINFDVKLYQWCEEF